MGNIVTPNGTCTSTSHGVRNPKLIKQEVLAHGPRD